MAMLIPVVIFWVSQPRRSQLNIYYLNLILHLLAQVYQYLALQCLHLCFTIGDMWVAMQVVYLS